MVYNCGDGTLGLTDITITDSDGSVSSLWKLVTPMGGYTELAPYGVKKFTVSMYSDGTSTSMSGDMALT